MIKIPIHSHPFTTSTFSPMECLNIDFIGPYPDKQDVMVIIDTFTRWVELYASPEATGLNAAENLLHHFGRFGAPTQIRSDRGSHFVNSVIKEFLPLVGTEHCCGPIRTYTYVHVPYPIPGLLLSTFHLQSISFPKAPSWSL